MWQSFEAHLCPLNRAVLNSGTKVALIESCCSIVFHVIVLYASSQPCSYHTLKVSRVEIYIVEKRSVLYGKLCTETAKLWSLLVTRACRGVSENTSMMESLLLNSLEGYGKLVRNGNTDCCIRFITGSWKWNGITPEIILSPYGFLCLVNSQFQWVSNLRLLYWVAQLNAFAPVLRN